MKRLIFLSITMAFWTTALSGPALFAQSPPFGIDVRTENQVLLIDHLPASVPGGMQTQRVFPRQAFNQPLLLVEVPDGSGRLAVVQKSGQVYLFPNTADPGPEEVSLLIDISDRVVTSGEQGLLGLAFDPAYAATGSFYLYYSWSGTSPGTSRISRFIHTPGADNDTIRAGEEIVLEIGQPYTNHNGGMLAFGPDGMLYIGLGDGGSGGDPLDSGQDTTTLLGSILRIDVSGPPDPGSAYAIPADNPFASGGPAGPLTRPEIWAYGFRNPWRMSFDRINGFLLAGDVGQSTREEIDAVAAGGNYGWRIMEGTLCFDPPNCDPAGLVLPLADYGRADGNSVTGGYVYHGSEVPDLYGTYVYGDYGSGRIFGLRYDGVTVNGPYILVDASGFNIAGFGQDAAGEVYVLDFFGGGIYVLRPVVPGGDFPTRLSDIPALLDAGKGADQSGQGIIPYAPVARLWSDGALKERFMALPGLDPIGYREDAGWDFTENAVLIKNFLMPMDERDPDGTAVRLETRLLYRKSGQWHGFSYEWNDTQTDAVLLWTAKEKPLSIIDANGRPRSFNYLFPARAQCVQCHTNAANGVLGLNTAQMNTDFAYPASGVTDNQLRTYDHISLFSSPLPGSPENLPRMPDPMDTSADIEDRARAYLAANCAMCHRPGGPAPTSLDFRWGIPPAQMNAVDQIPGNGDFNIPDARIISTASVAQSVLIYRMGLRDGLYQMPPLATARVDDEGYSLISNWILSFQGPVADTLGTTLVTPTAAVLNGRVTPRGIVTDYYFEYWIDPGTVFSTPVASAGSGVADTHVNHPVSGLTPDTIYNFRLIAENRVRAAAGEIRTFSTRLLYVSSGAPPSGCGGNSPCYPSIGLALADLLPGEDAVIRVDDQVYPESVTAANEAFVTLIGGWNSSFTAIQGVTSVSGTFEITGGGVQMEGFVFLPSLQ